MKQFLILAETQDTGYFVEIVDDLETANLREKLFFDLAFNPPTDHEKLRQEFTPLGTYRIDSEIPFPFVCQCGTLNGFYATYVLEIDKLFCFEEFRTTRNNQL